MGIIIKLGFQNLFRHRRRTLLTISAILLAVGIVTYIQCHLKGIIDSMVDDFIRLHTGHVKIIHPQYQTKERLLPLNLNLSAVDELMAELQRIPEVKQVAPRLRFGGMLNFKETNQTGMGVGVLPERETDLLLLEKDIKGGGGLQHGGIIVGEILASQLGVQLGDEVTVLSQTQYHSITAGNFRVSGILATGFSYIDRSTFYLHLKDAQEMLDMENRASELIIRGEHREKTSSLAAALAPLVGEKNLTLLTWLEQGGMAQMLKSTEVGIGVLVVVVLFLAGLTIANTMLMSVLERTREIGTLLAMGMRPFQVVTLFLMEGFYLGFFGSMGGILLGTVFTLILQHTGISIEGALENMSLPMASVVYPRFFWGAPLLALVFGTLVAMLASLLPAYRASRMLPREAML